MALKSVRLGSYREGEVLFNPLRVAHLPRRLKPILHSKLEQCARVAAAAHARTSSVLSAFHLVQQVAEVLMRVLREENDRGKSLG